MALPGSATTPTAPTTATLSPPPVAPRLPIVAPRRAPEVGVAAHEAAAHEAAAHEAAAHEATAHEATAHEAAPHPAASRAPDVVIDLGQLRPALVRAARLFAETVMIPTLLLMVLLHTAGLATGMYAVLGWSVLTVSIRWLTGRRLPGTLLLAAGVMCTRAAVALALSSALVYLVQPIAGSVAMALLFLGSAAVGRPITMRLARDFVALPGHLFHSPAVRRMFTQVALVWGVSRLIDVGMSIGFLRWGVEAGLLSRGLLSATLTVLTVAACTAWGWRSLRRIPGISLRLRSTAPAATG